MLGYLILLFTVIPIIELSILIKIGQHLGAASAIGIVILTGVIGAYLAKMQGLRILYRIKEDLNQGIMPTDKLFDGVLILCSGILLITPGLLTDIVGFLGLIPLTRNLFKRWLKGKAEDFISQGKVITITSFKSK